MSIFESLVNYLQSAKTELEKVTWPSKQDTIRYSSLVAAISVIVAIFFATLDYGLATVVEAALNRQAAVPAQQLPPPPAESHDVTPIDTNSDVPGLNLEQTSSTFFPTKQ